MDVWTLPARDAHFDENGRMIQTPSP